MTTTTANAIGAARGPSRSAAALGMIGAAISGWAASYVVWHSPSLAIAALEAVRRARHNAA